MLRIVFDTNVYISAALHGGLAEKALHLAAIEQITLIISDAILAELEEKLREKLQWSDAQITFFIETIQGIAVLVHPAEVLHVVPDDEDDNRIIEAAVAGDAALIISFDKDLLRLRQYEQIGIIHPRELMFYGLGD